MQVNKNKGFAPIWMIITLSIWKCVCDFKVSMSPRAWRPCVCDLCDEASNEIHKQKQSTMFPPRRKEICLMHYSWSLEKAWWQRSTKTHESSGHPSPLCSSTPALSPAPSVLIFFHLSRKHNTAETNSATTVKQSAVILNATMPDAGIASKWHDAMKAFPLSSPSGIRTPTSVWNVGVDSVELEFERIHLCVGPNRFTVINQSAKPSIFFFWWDFLIRLSGRISIMDMQENSHKPRTDII